jgi:hypothetical protein
MTTHTKTETPSESEICRMAGLQQASVIKWQGGYDWKQYQTIITRQNHHISKVEAERDNLREQVRELLAASKQVDVAYETLSDEALNDAIDNMRAVIKKSENHQ